MKSVISAVHKFRGVLALAATLLVVPFTSAFHPAEAKPPRHAPAYGYRAKKGTSSSSYRRYQTRRSTTRRTYTYPTRTVRRYPTRTYRSNQTSNRRTYRTPSGATRTRTYQRTYRRSTDR